MKKTKLLSIENITFVMALMGFTLGWLLPNIINSFSLLGDVFIMMLKAMILPVIISSVFLALAKSSSGLAQLGLRTLTYFLGTGALACLTGLIVANGILEKPSTALNFQNFDPSQMKALAPKDFILSFFAENPFRALAEGQIVPIVLLTILSGIAATRLQAKKQEILIEWVEAIHDLVMTLLSWILKSAPVGVFALTAVMASHAQDMQISQLGNFFLAVAVAAFIHSLITLPALGFLIGKFSPYRFILDIKEALVVALATASSAATLPVSTRMLEQQKVSPRVVGFVLPLGASLNMNGSALYQSLVVLFFGHIVGVDFTLSQQFLVFLLVMLSAAGTAGIPGGGLMMMGTTLQILGLPLELIGLYLLVDRFWDPPITMINVMDDLFAAKCIDRWLRSNPKST